ncbi:zinc finger protein 235-like [Argiope bruennichi]|uniref:zinc finger protein 235-like n=1 Tax=Argiope bruennichi TaxID=94029 RepID=UPI002493DCC6|nr:zinc finger protein 235-like [Argiope bruennichi]
MGKCRCKRCGNIRGEDHACFIHKKFDYRYSIQQRAESDDNLDEGNDKSTENSNDDSQNLSRAFGRKESERTELTSLSLFQNTERDISTRSAVSSNYVQLRSPSDSSHFHSISDFQAIQVQTNQNASFRDSSINAEPNNRHENDFIETYNRDQAAAGSSGIDIQNQIGSSGSDLMHAKPDEECKMYLEESKSQSLKKDKKDFMDVLEYVIRNALSDNNNISGTANSTMNPDLLSGSKEPKSGKRQVSEVVNEEHISHEVHSEVHSKKTKVATYVKEPHSTKKDDNAVAGPSGISPRKKNFPKTFSKKDTLKPNYKTHTGNEPFTCICDKKFYFKSEHDRHYKTHTGEKPYECVICGKKFSRNDRLIIHYRVHTGEKPHVCEFCNKGFSQKGNLEIHVRTHTGEKPYECVICEKKFSRKSYLIIHYRVHTGEKPHVCEFCNKGFSQKGNLEIHVRTHTGEKPYKCPSCEESFMNSRDFKSHHKRKHE